MELDEVKVQFKEEIEKFLKRIQINHIVCLPPRHFNGKLWTEKECDKYLHKDGSHKLVVSTVFLFNDHNNRNIKHQADETKEINDSLRECAQFLTDVINEFCKQGENQYELNELLGNTILIIDAYIQKMNYENWKNETLKNNPTETFFLVFKNKKISKHGVYIDLQSFCWPLVEPEFEIRKLFLYRLKNYLTDIYSKYLLLPSIGVNLKLTIHVLKLIFAN
jgi:hypothetical protein